MKIGQIIYNLEDYAGSGGLLSTSKKDINVIVKNVDNENYEEDKINIFEDSDKDILENYGLKNIVKLGIQAAPGTQFYLNRNKKLNIEPITIMIGRTGIYELNIEDKGFVIEALSFKRPINYVLDIKATNDYINNGLKQMRLAKEKFDKSYNALKLQFEAPTSTLTNEQFWERYDIIHREYVKEYNTARVVYIKGLNGVYQSSGNNDLRNVIIDFKCEENTTGGAN